MLADRGSESVVEVEGAGDAILQHAQPFGGGLLKSNRTKEIGRLDDDL